MPVLQLLDADSRLQQNSGLLLRLGETSGEKIMNQTTIKTPVHLWIVGILAVLWNAMGAFDYSATQLRLDFYMSQFTQEQLDYFYAFPSWMKAAWAIAVWSSLLASLALLLRKSWAAGLFGLAILGLATSSVYNFVLSNGAEMMGSGAVMFTAVIWVIAIALFFYARAMAKKGVLQ
jgi:hypothetical protein